MINIIALCNFLSGTNDKRSVTSELSNTFRHLILKKGLISIKNFDGVLKLFPQMNLCLKTSLIAKCFLFTLLASQILDI